MTCCLRRVHSSSSFGLRLGGDVIQNRFVSSSNRSSTDMNDLKVIKKFLMKFVSDSTVRMCIEISQDKTHLQSHVPSTSQQARTRYQRAHRHQGR